MKIIQITLKVRPNSILLEGIILHRNRASAIARPGAHKNKYWEELVGVVTCFINNLIASANGCVIPPSLTLLGPLRDCDSPRILRSKSVKKATLSSTGMAIEIQANILSIITLG